jgi:hypothetical protein
MYFDKKYKKLTFLLNKYIFFIIFGDRAYVRD